MTTKEIFLSELIDDNDVLKAMRDLNKSNAWASKQ